MNMELKLVKISIVFVPLENALTLSQVQANTSEKTMILVPKHMTVSKQHFICIVLLLQ